MKVLQLISTRGFFGAENMVIELACALEAAGDSVTVGVFSNRHTDGAGSSELAGQARSRGLATEVFECSGRVDLETVKRIRGFCEDNGVEVIHSHGYKSNIYAYLANRKLGRRLVTTCHNWINANSKMSLYTRLDKFFLRRFDAVVAVSDDVRGQLLTAGIKPERLKVIANGIDLKKFRRPSAGAGKIRRELGIPEGAKVIGTVGRLSKEKGYRFLLEAAVIVMKEMDCFFLFVGDGPEMHSLQEQSRSLGIAGRVIFAGRRADIPEVLSAMDIFAMSSLTEGQPMALLEAMAAGKPCVATAVGDVPKILSKGKAGLPAPPSDSTALARALLRILGDGALAEVLSANAAAVAERDYSSSRMAAGYRACYGE